MLCLVVAHAFSVKTPVKERFEREAQLEEMEEEQEEMQNQLDACVDLFLQVFRALEAAELLHPHPLRPPSAPPLKTLWTLMVFPPGPR